MRNKWWNKQLFFSIFFFLIFIGAVVANELDIFKKYTTVPVVMAKETIDKDTKITEDMLYIYQMEREFVNDGMFRNVKDVVGKTATQLIMPGQYVSPLSLDASILRPTAEHEFFPIPDDWLIGIQGTIRRYDSVNLSVLYVGTKSNDEEPVEVKVHNIKNEFILQNIPVAYVKGGQNEEVTGVKNSDDRLYGTTRPSSIQLSLTLEEFKNLEKLVLEGYRIILSL